MADRELTRTAADSAGVEQAVKLPTPRGILAMDLLDRLCRDDPMLVRRRLRAAGCPMCGGSMDEAAEHAIYCSRSCQREAYNIARRGR